MTPSNEMPLEIWASSSAAYGNPTSGTWINVPAGANIKYLRATPDKVMIDKKELERVNIFALNMCAYFAHHGIHPNEDNFILSQQALQILEADMKGEG